MNHDFDHNLVDCAGHDGNDLCSLICLLSVNHPPIAAFIELRSNPNLLCLVNLPLVFKPYVSLEHKRVISNTGIFVAIANNTLYGSKLSIFLLRQKSLAIKIMFHVNFLP